MSWQSYVDDHLVATSFVKEAVICGHDGSIWAKSANFGVTPDELKTLISNHSNVNTLAASGVVVDKTKYVYLSSTDKVIRGKLDKGGLHCFKTTQAYIISKYNEPTMPEQCATVTEKLGDYLISVGY